MIAKIKGTIWEKENDYLILNVSGVGYRVFCAQNTLDSHSDDSEIELYIHHIVREQQEDLYGFSEKEDEEFFSCLLAVSGIGPRSALGIMNVASVPTLKRAIGAGDLTYLTGVSGIGKKTAQKILVELKEKLEGFADEHEDETGKSDAHATLVALGYSAGDAREAIRELPDTILGVSNQVKEALRNLQDK
ncbi:MAG: Holliday junction DNA helicase RuvA [Flavobacteriaceae bacterium]|jgi:Holliday junction DNA helicase RuvA